jgi:hypothetical protein
MLEVVVLDSVSVDAQLALGSLVIHQYCEGDQRCAVDAVLNPDEI